MLIKGDYYLWNANAYMALKAARFSSKKDSSIQKNLEFKHNTRKGKKNMVWMDLIWEYQQNKCPLYLIRFTRTDELWNLADADFARPRSSRTARSSSLTVTFSRSTRLISEWLQPLKSFQLLNNTEWLPIHFLKKEYMAGRASIQDLTFKRYSCDLLGDVIHGDNGARALWGPAGVLGQVFILVCVGQEGHITRGPRVGLKISISFE